MSQLGKFLSSEDGPIHRYTPKSSDIDSLIEVIVILAGKSCILEQDIIPDFFWPATGKWKMRGKTLCDAFETIKLTTL